MVKRSFMLLFSHFHLLPIKNFLLDTHKRGSVVVAISDVSGTVKYYQEMEENLSRGDESLASPVTGDGVHIAAVVYKGEESFPLIVFTFRPMVGKEIGNEGLFDDVDSYVEENEVHLLLVVTTDGDLMHKHVDEFGANLYTMILRYSVVLLFLNFVTMLGFDHLLL